MNKIIFNDIPFHSIEKDKLFFLLNENIFGERETKHIVITNTESMYFANKRLNHKKYIEEAELSLCDGVAIVLAAKLHKINIKRYHGPDFMLDVIKIGLDKEWRHYFLGGQQEVNVNLQKSLMRIYPNINITGSYSPPYRDINKDEEIEMILNIKKSQPDFIWVGLGLPKQEEWIAKYKDAFETPWSIGVGAAFDFHAGSKSRSPKMIQNIGLEWLFRLFKEPRMIKRNLRSIYQFLILIKSYISRSKL